MPATNSYGVSVPSTVLQNTKTYHGVSIRAQDGKAVLGRVQSWNPTFGSREGIHLWELNRDTFGRPVEYVPGKESGRSISCSAVELWGAEFETELAPSNSIATGQGPLNSTVEWSDLCDQTQPVTMQESMFRGTIPYRTWGYFGTWFSELSQQSFEAEGDATVRKDATLQYVVRRRI